MDSEKRERGAPFSVQSGFPGLLEEALELHKPSSDRMFSKLFATDTELEHRQRKTSPFSSLLGWKMVFPIAVSQNFLINGVCRRCSVLSLSRHGGVRYPNTLDGFLSCIRENDAAVSFQMDGIPLVCKWGIVFTWGLSINFSCSHGMLETQVLPALLHLPVGAAQWEGSKNLHRALECSPEGGHPG